MRIGILRELDDPIHNKLISTLIGVWEKQGHEILHLDPAHFDSACDLIFVHVDLSVLPPEFADFIAAQKIPVINGRAGDIRKTAISFHQVQSGDGWEGPVIVKSVENYMGEPEQGRKRRALKKKPIRYLLKRLKGPAAFQTLPFREYPILRHQREVPASWWQRDDLLVEQFMPERDGELYVMRKYVFLGSKFIQLRTYGPKPLVSLKTQIGSEAIEEDPPEEVLAMREKLGLDYGKIDYAFHGGRCIVYDANKTLGIADSTTPRIIALAEYLGDGIHDFIKGLEG